MSQPLTLPKAPERRPDGIADPPLSAGVSSLKSGATVNPGVKSAGGHCWELLKPSRDVIADRGGFCSPFRQAMPARCAVLRDMSGRQPAWLGR
jgi:hypothetical protein